jgi:hypothetical protein
MTTTQTSMDERTEADFVAALERKAPRELRNFLLGPWTASILSPEAIEELFGYLQQHLEEPSHQDGEQTVVGLD